jgi:hypothetical protein
MMHKSADISECGTYRYRLTRSWAAGYSLFFVMLNPSTADADIDDPTIRRCMVFAKREGAGGIVVANLFAFRATSPEVMKAAPDPFGPGNAQVLHCIGMESAAFNVPIVCAWGTQGGDAVGYVTRLFAETGARLVCLGKTKDGHPRHPLYVKGDQPLVSFP